MDPATQTNAAPAEQDAAQPDATGTTAASAEQSAPTKSAAEEKLEGQLKTAEKQRDTYKKERDTARTQLAKASEERDELRTENEQLKQEKAEAAQAQASDVATSTEASAEAQDEPTKEQEIKALLVRYGLKEAFVMPDGTHCFDREHAQRFMGADFDSLTVISAE